MLHDFIRSCSPENGILSPPIRPRFKATFAVSPDDLRDPQSCFVSLYVADNMVSALDNILEHKHKIFPFLISLALDGFYVYDCFYPLDSIEDCPVDIDILAYCAV